MPDRLERRRRPLPRRLRTGLLLALALAFPARAEPERSVLVDQAHYNVHGPDRGYAEAAALLAAADFVITTTVEPLTVERLALAEVLLIPAPRGAGREAPMSERERSVFSADEIEAIARWVEAGGGLLLVTDHPPVGNAARTLTERFGVTPSLAFTEDSRVASVGSGDWAPDGRDILFTPATGLGDHAITRGRDEGERVERVATFLGQSLSGPPGSTSLLTLQPTARDRVGRWDGSSWAESTAADVRAPAGGRSQALALTAGRGRVVILGEAGLWTARGLAASAHGPDGLPLDNGRFLLSTIRWLAGDLD